MQVGKCFYAFRNASILVNGLVIFHASLVLGVSHIPDRFQNCG
jgi:hypothetical protein